jgi:signal peptidase I
MEEAVEKASTHANLIGGEWGYVDVSERSMWTVIRNDGFVVWEDVNVCDLKVGDVVIAKGKKMNVIHRVVRHNGDYVVTKGDSNQYMDSFRTTDANLLGRLDHTVYTCL